MPNDKRLNLLDCDILAVLVAAVPPVVVQDQVQ